MTKNVLVVGGSSGLGLELAIRFADMSEEYAVHITGTGHPSPLSGFTKAGDHRVFIPKRTDRKEKKGIRYYMLGLSWRTDIQIAIHQLVSTLLTTLPRVDLLVYAAGFLQEGRMSDLSVDDIIGMTNIGLLAPQLLLRWLLKKQGSIDGFIAISSNSQWKPRPDMPIYAATKAGLAHLAHSVSFDQGVEKVLVVAPAGMKTNFWANNDRDTSSMLEPGWVAEEVMKHYAHSFEYMLLSLLKEPPRVEVVETR